MRPAALDNSLTRSVVARLVRRLARHAREFLHLPADLVDRRRQLFRCRSHRLNVGGGFFRSAPRPLWPDFLRPRRGRGQHAGRAFELARGRRYGCDDLSDRAFETIGHPVHVGLALAHLPLFGLDLFGTQSIGFDHGVLEHHDGSRHLADLIGTTGVGDGKVQFALAQCVHAQLEAGQRLDHAARHQPGDADRKQQQSADQGGHRPRHTPERDVEIGHVFGGRDHHVPRCITADVSHLLERGLRAAPGKRISDRSLAALRHIEHHLGKGKSGRVFQTAHVLSDQPGIAGVHDAQTGLGVVDEDVVGMAFEPDGAGGGREARFRLLLAHRARLGGAFETVRHAPDGVDDGMGSLGPLGGKFATGDEKNREGDEHHEERAGNGHGGKFGCNRMLCDELEQSLHGYPPPRTCRSVVSRHIMICSSRRFRPGERSYQFVN